MFNLIRRISYGAIQRPDRPWEEDATSNAPAPRKKRRLSSVEREDSSSKQQQEEHDDELARKKRSRQEDVSMDADSAEAEVSNGATPSVGGRETQTPMPQPEAETSEVKEVTDGVAEVDLDADSKAADATEDSEVGAEKQKEEEAGESDVTPESVPLPEEDAAGELEEEEESAVAPAEDAVAEAASSSATAVSDTDKETPSTVVNGQRDNNTEDEEATENAPASVDPTTLALPTSPKAASASAPNAAG